MIFIKYKTLENEECELLLFLKTVKGIQKQEVKDLNKLFYHVIIYTDEFNFIVRDENKIFINKVYNELVELFTKRSFNYDNDIDSEPIIQNDILDVRNSIAMIKSSISNAISA